MTFVSSEQLAAAVVVGCVADRITNTTSRGLHKMATIPWIYGSSKCLLPHENLSSKRENMVAFATKLPPISSPELHLEVEAKLIFLKRKHKFTQKSFSTCHVCWLLELASLCLSKRLYYLFICLSAKHENSSFQFLQQSAHKNSCTGQ